MSPLPETPGVVTLEPEGSLGLRVFGALIFIPLGAAFISAFTDLALAIALGLAALALFVVISRDSLHAALAWTPPLIQVSSESYALGSTPTIVYRRKPRRVRDISSCQVGCRIVCQERATYTRGSDTTTETRDIYESSSTGPGEGTVDGLVAHVELDISAHAGAPSFRLSHNQIRWFVEIAISGQGLPEDSHTFVIDVGPSLDPRYRTRVQDT